MYRTCPSTRTSMDLKVRNHCLYQQLQKDLKVLQKFSPMITRIQDTAAFPSRLALLTKMDPAGAPYAQRGPRHEQCKGESSRCVDGTAQRRTAIENPYQDSPDILKFKDGFKKFKINYANNYITENKLKELKRLVKDHVTFAEKDGVLYPTPVSKQTSQLEKDQERRRKAMLKKIK